MRKNTILIWCSSCKPGIFSKINRHNVPKKYKNKTKKNVTWAFNIEKTNTTNKPKVQWVEVYPQSTFKKTYNKYKTTVKKTKATNISDQILVLVLCRIRTCLSILVACRQFNLINNCPLKNWYPKSIIILSNDD
ncbi:hypothetical protein Hanom_Chr15g01391031 [Helianthus anomalus]